MDKAPAGLLGAGEEASEPGRFGCWDSFNSPKCIQEKAKGNEWNQQNLANLVNFAYSDMPKQSFCLFCSPIPNKTFVKYDIPTFPTFALTMSKFQPRDIPAI